jgi:hypothetical protein
MKFAAVEKRQKGVRLFCEKLGLLQRIPMPPHELVLLTIGRPTIAWSFKCTP